MGQKRKGSTDKGGEGQRQEGKEGGEEKDREERGREWKGGEGRRMKMKEGGGGEGNREARCSWGTALGCVQCALFILSEDF